MRRAVELAARGLGSTSPNPVVGCVITDAAGTVVGEGWHQRAGGPHAEVHALRAAGGAARGATAYVTLEPCGARSGGGVSCAERLVQAGVARVVIGCADPSPYASGQGERRLKAGGVAVTFGVLEADARALVADWLALHLEGSR